MNPNLLTFKRQPYLRCIKGLKLAISLNIIGAIRSSLVVFLLLPAFWVNAKANENAVVVEPSVQSNQELQWILAVPNEHWHNTMKTLANYLDNNEFEKADKQLTHWLNNDFEQALLALPAMNQFFFYFDAPNIAPLFANRLQQEGLETSMNILASLGLRIQSVSLVGQQLLINEWRDNPQAFKAWVTNTPSFFEDIYLDEFVNFANHKQADLQQLADFFYQLSMNDERQSRYFNLVVERWLEANPTAAIDYIERLYQASANAKSRQLSKALNQIMSTVAYYLNFKQDYVQALIWASRITDNDIKEPSVRDFCISLNDNKHLTLFTDWLALHPITNNELATEIASHFAALNAKATP